MTEFELDEELEEEEYAAEIFVDGMPDMVAEHDKAIKKLIDQVARLANKLDEHLKEADAHNCAVLARNKNV